ncbi:TonB-dependent siderophore receptor [Frigidibacter sp. MR17.24]|uniref:TonB-dependent siderophore receptor n=1 Tax=Frigidibacter sp. MR17.24 TaxID=3127345 RepID=UPI003012DB67
MTLSRTALLMLGACSLPLAPVPAQAQDRQAGDELVLDTITLTATPDSTVAAEGYVGPYSQGATKSSTPVAGMQQSVSVITTDQIRDQGAETLGRALSYTAGVVGEPFGADPRFDSPTIRGFEARGAQYVNGLRQLRYMGAPAYETYGLQQVEVLKGPSSSLYGAGSPAGIINQVSKRAQDVDFGEVGLGFDSNDSSQAFFDVNRAASDDLAFRLTGIGRDSHTQIDELGNERGYLAGALRWRPDAFTTIDVIASYTQDSPISPTGVPYALTETASGRTLRELQTGEEDWDRSDRRMWNTGVEISHELDTGWTLSQGVRYEAFDWDYTGTYVSGLSADGSQILRGANAQDEDTTGLNLDTRLAGVVTTGAVTHRLLFGLDLRRYEADTTTEFFYGTPLDWRNPDYGDIPTGSAWYTSITSVEQTQVGLYAQDEFEIGNWRGSVALRQDWTEQTGDTYTNFAGDGTIDQSDSALTGRAGLGYQFAGGVMPYVSYATSFDPEIGTDEDGDTLDPLTARQWELGVKYQPAGMAALFTAAIYDLRQENVTVALGNGLSRQIGEVTSRGLELEATAELTPDWSLRAGLSWNDTEQVGGTTDGLEMPNAPERLASLWLDHDLGNGVSLGGGVRYIGARKGDLANTYDLDAVTLVDLGARYERGAYSASLNLSNLTDEVYVANCGTFGCFYGEGRTVTARVTYKW